MKYKLIGSNNIFSPVETVLENREITKDLFNLDKSIIEDYNNYDNMQEGVELLIKHLENNNKIVILVDPDTDGMTSYAVIYRYIKELYPNTDIKIIYHLGKQHGIDNFVLKRLRALGWCNLLIVPDAASNDYKSHKYLKKIGIDILILDHHDADYLSKNALVINNQISEKVINKNLSGVGVVYKFIKAVDDYLFENKSSKYKDLVCLGNVADVMNLKEKETRYFVYEGIKQINNPFIKALIEHNSYDLEGKYNIDKIGWTIAPKLNGTIRSGTQEEKKKMIDAFISDDYDYCLEIAKMCKNVKKRQDDAVKLALKKLEGNLDIKEGDKCIILNVGNDLNQSHTGLVAGKFADKYKLPTLLYRDVKGKTGYVGGSFRGIDSMSEDLKSDLQNSNLTTFSQGHNQAGGFEVKKKNLSKLKEYLNNLYKDIEGIDGKEHQVDFILENDEIDEYIVNELAQLENEFGNGIDYPLVVFKDVEISITDSNIKKTLIMFYANNIKFIKKFPTKQLKDDLRDKTFTADIVGKCTINTYNNTGQVEIVDFEIK